MEEIEMGTRNGELEMGTRNGNLKWKKTRNRN